MKQYTHREFVKMCKLNGFTYDKHKGSHAIYRHTENGRHISIPKNINSCIALRLIKENNLKYE